MSSLTWSGAAPKIVTISEYVRRRMVSTLTSPAVRSASCSCSPTFTSSIRLPKARQSRGSIVVAVTKSPAAKSISAAPVAMGHAGVAACLARERGKTL